MNKHILIAMLAPALVTMSGCLKTRGDVKDSEERGVLQQQVVSLQKETADTGNRSAELNEELRDMRGRVEVLEHKLNGGNSELDKARESMKSLNEDSNRKVQLLQDAVTRLDTQVQQMSAEMQGMRADLAAQASRDAAKESAAAESAKAASSSKQNQFDVGVDHFKEKDWKKAILSFQKYRDKNPKGKNFPEATYLMGVAFQELGMKDEAKTFFDEVIVKFPNAPEAKKSKTRLKSLKK